MKPPQPDGEITRKGTPNKANEKIDRQILENISKYAGKSPEEIAHRIKQLDKEWDIERVLDVVMPGFALIGITLSFIISKYSLILPILFLSFYLMYAFIGWCPPIPILRYFKVRTRPEIDREKYALKVMRGDFSDLENDETLAEQAFEAVRKI